MNQFKAITAEQVQLAHTLRDAGMPWPEIAIRTGCAVNSLQRRFREEKETPEEREARNAKARVNHRNRRTAQLGSGRWAGFGKGERVYLSQEVPEHLLADREARAEAADQRSVCARLMGDPPKGYSALDRMRAR